MSYFEALLIAEARAKGRAQRSAQFRHRHLTKKPLGVLCWQLGAEPFTAAAIAWGTNSNRHELVVAGEPRDRELTFRALTKFARSFNVWFESDANREEPPQIVVPNRGNLKLLGRLGRRLAFLTERDGVEPDPELVRFGKHLLFLAERARFPGQQLVIVATDLLATHWVTGLSDFEAQNLPALDAAIDPPRGKTPDEAAADAEKVDIGPLPGADDDDAVEKLMKDFDTKRGRGAGGRLVTDARVVEPLLAPFRTHYDRMVERGWSLLWRSIERERAYPAARSVERRWLDDVAELDRHLGWVVGKSGRYRTRATNLQAARRLAEWEKAQRRLEAEEIVDDPFRMIPCLLKHDALAGRVIKTDLSHRETAEKRAVRRPLVWVETEDPCLMPEGKELYWTRTASAAPWFVEEIAPSNRGGSVVLLKRSSSSDPGAEPAAREDVVFSVHSTAADGYFAPMHPTPPWTHVKRTAPAGTTIEDGDGRPWE